MSEFTESVAFDCGYRAGKKEAQAEIDELVEASYGMLHAKSGDEHGHYEMKLKTLIAKHKGE